MSATFDGWVDQLSSWQDATSSIPRLVREDIIKARLKPDDVSRGMKSISSDPLSIQYAMGYKDRKYSLSYDTLKRIPQQLSIIGAIINTRVNQVSAFSVPFRSSKSVGFVIKHKDPAHLTTKSEVQFIKDLETFIYNCGHTEPNPHSHGRRDTFETFLKKFTRDSCTYDQAACEIIPDRRGRPYEFAAVDASTIRIAARKGVGVDDTYHGRSPAYNARLWNYMMTEGRGPYRSLQMYEGQNKQDVSYVQVVNGQIYNVYSEDELMFGVRNPRSDIYVHGYGYSEMEQLITVITSHLYAEEYNRRFFMNSSSPKGMLVFKGDSMSPDMMEGFRRQWRETLEGVSNAWKTPVLQSEAGVDWIDLHPSNREMEYGQWLEYLIKIGCSIWLIDPAEINFDLHGGVQQTPLFESSQEWKLKASRDRGLKPLLRFISQQINQNIISKLDDHFVFDFAGLDELTEQEKHTLRMEQVTSYLTLNEVRRAEDLDDLEHGDLPMNPTYLQAMQIRLQADQQKQQAEAAQKQQAAPAAGAQASQGAQQGEEEQAQSAAPEYADRFSKSSNSKFLSIELDDWIGAVQPSHDD
jgi:hypothetical protein